MDAVASAPVSAKAGAAGAVQFSTVMPSGRPATSRPLKVSNSEAAATAASKATVVSDASDPSGRWIVTKSATYVVDPAAKVELTKSWNDS